MTERKRASRPKGEAAVRQNRKSTPSTFDAAAALKSGGEVVTERGAHHLQRLGGNKAATAILRAKLSEEPAGDRDEVEADQVASDVMRNLQGRGDGAQVLQARPIHTPAQPVQRMMSRKQWFDVEKSTGLSVLKSDTRKLFKTKRDKIVAVDAAMGEYSSVGDYSRWKPDIADAKVPALQNVIAAAAAYLALSEKDVKKADRRVAVETLKAQAEVEEGLLRRVIAARDDDNMKTKMDALLALQAEALSKKATHATSGVGGYATDLILQAAQEHDQADRPALEALVGQDAAKLEAVGDDPEAPAIVKAVIAEALEHIEAIHLGAFYTAGARVPNAKELEAGVESKYVVNHKLGAVLGEPERLASLMHELTHVVAGETYQNTIMFLAFDPKQGEAAVVEEAKARYAALKLLLEQSTAAAESGVIDGDQLLLLKDKIGYGGASDQTGDKLVDYLKRFKASLPEETHAKLDGLAKSLAGFSSTVVEYDSVINQVLMLAYSWKLPKSEPLYANVLQLAADAKAKRDQHRAAMLANAGEEGAEMQGTQKTTV